MNRQVNYPQYLDKRQLAKLLGCDVRTIDRWRSRGLLRAIILSPSMIRFDMADVQETLERLKETPAA